MRKILNISSSQGCLGKNIGCEKAPEEIVNHLKNSYVIDNVEIDNLNIEKTNKNIFDKSIGFNGIIIGGDHSISYPAIKALSSSYKKIGFIMMDAHVDCASYIKPPSHEDFLRVLIEDKVVNEKNILLIGVRKIYDVEKKYLKGKKICIMPPRHAMGYKKFLNQFEKLDAVYLSIDIDALDPKIAMGTGYKVKGGIDKNVFFSILNDIKRLKNLIIVDLVEVNPKLDDKNKTVRLAAEIVDYFYS